MKSWKVFVHSICIYSIHCGVLKLTTEINLKNLPVHSHTAAYTSVWLVMLYSMVNLAQLSTVILSSRGDEASRKNLLIVEVLPATRLLLLCFSVSTCRSMAAFPLLLTSTSHRQSLQKPMEWVLTAFRYKLMLFRPFWIEQGLTFWHDTNFRMKPECIWRSSTWTLVYVSSQWYSRYLTPLLANHLLNQMCDCIGRCAASQHRV